MTGVTVALLAIGLFAAGAGTMIFLRNAQIAAIDDQLRSVVSTDLVSTMMTVDVDGGIPTFSVSDSSAPTPYFVAVYAPDGTLVASAGGSGGVPPEYPVIPLSETVMGGIDPFVLESADGHRTFHASVDVLSLPEVSDNYTQLVAYPLTGVTQTVTNFIGIYTVLAILTILGGALLTRALVTLTFRGLGQVEDTAMSIAAGDFSQRMTDISPRTEIGRLKTAMNAMLDRVDHALGQRDATVQQMRRFIGDASHELRTPLVTVRGYAELYRMGAISGDEQTAQSMERIEKEAIRMGGLVEDLLALARLDERRDIAVTDVDLRPIAQDAVLDARVTAPDRVITLVEQRFVGDSGSGSSGSSGAGSSGSSGSGSSGSGSAGSSGSSSAGSGSAGSGSAGSGSAGSGSAGSNPAGAPRAKGDGAHGHARRSGAAPRTGTLARLRRRPRAATADAGAGAVAVEMPHPGIGRAPIVLGDDNRIRQVVANLLGNARRYTPAGSPIELGVGADPVAEMGWIAVIDHGEGIPEQIRDKIFQRFWRADTSRTRETGGSGLGLSIVASVVEALHGSITVSETPGGGATFRVAFPLAQRRDAAEHVFIETQPLPRIPADGAR